MNKWVFTGGMSTGKTTTINLLKKQGYQIIPEASEKILINYKSKYNKYPWEDNTNNLLYFHKNVFNTQKKLELSTNSTNNIFLDRGMPDRLVFCQIDKVDLVDDIKEYISNNKYKGIFLFETNEKIYENSAHRPQNIEHSKLIESLITKTYKELGYNPIKVPFLPQEERVKFILDKVNQN